MTLAAGARFEHYEIESAIGVGRHGRSVSGPRHQAERDVALKVLPRPSPDPDRLARLDREAKFLAALNHPNIAAIYGVAVVRSTQRTRDGAGRGRDARRRD